MFVFWKSFSILPLWSLLDFFSWTLNSSFLESWNQTSLDSWILFLKSFSWSFCHHLCYHQNSLNQSWFNIMKLASTICPYSIGHAKFLPLPLTSNFWKVTLDIPNSCFLMPRKMVVFHQVSTTFSFWCGFVGTSSILAQWDWSVNIETLCRLLHLIMTWLCIPYFSPHFIGAFFIFLTTLKVIELSTIFFLVQFGFWSFGHDYIFHMPFILELVC